MASSTSTKVFLVTANIASCFDNPEAMLNPWLDEFFKVIRERDPAFVALHCQEIGGKHYETSMENVDRFLRNLLNRASLLHFTRARLFIDENYNEADKFTALGNIYFVRHDVQDVKMWNFKEKAFVPVEGREEYVGKIEDVPIKEKSKFPQEFFPECKWSRKGFLRTRWNLNGTQFDLVNIHLFHDASNLIAMEKFPSVYTMNRKRAMEHTLDRFHNDEFENLPIFLFGDFNFRLDTGSVVQKLTEDCNVPQEMEVSGEKTREFKHRREDRSVLSVSKKSFSHIDHCSIFMKDMGSWLRSFDKELPEFTPRLQEFPIHFPPSYPFEEGPDSKDTSGGDKYMKTRCPSWCDRVIFTQSAKQLLQKSESEVHYNIIGLNARMGDHKPVGLCVGMPSRAGSVACCTPTHPCSNLVHDPLALCFTVGAWCFCQAYPVCPESLQPPACDTLNTPALNSSSSPDSPIPPPGVENAPMKGRHSATADCLLKNLLRLGADLEAGGGLPLEDDGKGGDPLLKRVHSDPVKVRAYCELLRGGHGALHTHLMQSYSLDGHRKPPPPRLRLRSSSSRLISHHSSSEEEWFEEMSSSSEEEGVEGRSGGPSTPVRSSLLARTSFGSDADSLLVRDGIILTPRPQLQDHNSLNNLLLSDSGSTRSAAPSSDHPVPSNVLPPDTSTCSGCSKVADRICSSPTSDPSANNTVGRGGNVFFCAKKRDSTQARECCCSVS